MMRHGEERRALLDAVARGDETFDMVVIGGGITGVGVAREAARRHLRVLVLEQRDIAWGTSSRSSKMVHGGLRYIAQGDIKLTRDALRERERLIAEAPYLIERLGYWFGHRAGKFPGPAAFGTLCAAYDFLAGIRDHRFANASEVLRRFRGLDDRALAGATRYTDSVTDDARLVLRTLDEAVADGAKVLTYTKVRDLIRAGDPVTGVVVEDVVSNRTFHVRASVVVNATGVWADRLRAPLTGEAKVRPLRGSHLVFEAARLPAPEALVFQHADDKRPVFIFPWEGRTVVGTTDLDHREDLDIEARISDAELDYLLRGANAQFPDAKLRPVDVLSTYAGIRPVVASGKRLSPSQERRDHVVWDDHGLVTVTGGKLTTFRLIALDVLRACERHVALRSADDGGAVFRPFDIACASHLPKPIRARILGHYGFLAPRFLEEMPPHELRPIPGTSTLWAELRWGARHERVVHLDDLLLRRTRIGNLLRRGGEEHEERIRAIVQPELALTNEAWAKEWTRYLEIVDRYYGLP